MIFILFTKAGSIPLYYHIWIDLNLPKKMCFNSALLVSIRSCIIHKISMKMAWKWVLWTRRRGDETQAISIKATLLSFESLHYTSTYTKFSNPHQNSPHRFWYVQIPIRTHRQNGSSEPTTFTSDALQVSLHSNATTASGFLRRLVISSWLWPSISGDVS